jgi:hypothetical protein
VPLVALAVRGDLDVDVDPRVVAQELGHATRVRVRVAHAPDVLNGRSFPSELDAHLDLWWPDYAEANLSDEGRDTQSVQLDLRIIPTWGDHQLRQLRPGPIEAWVAKLRKQGIGDPTIIKTLTVFRSDPQAGRARRGDRSQPDPAGGEAEAATRARTAADRALLRRAGPPAQARPDATPRQTGAPPRAAAGTRASSRRNAGQPPCLLRATARVEALPLRWSQIGKRTITYRATKGGAVKPRRTRLLAPLARDLAEFRVRCGRPGDEELVFGEWSGDDWDNWRERIFQPAAVAVGLPEDTIPRDRRGSFASLLIYEGLNVLEVAPQLGHKPSTCLDIYGRLFEEFDPARRRPAAEVIRETRNAVRAGALPTGYPAGPLRSDQAGRATAEGATSRPFRQSPLPDSNRRPLPYHREFAVPTSPQTALASRTTGHGRAAEDWVGRGSCPQDAPTKKGRHPRHEGRRSRTELRQYFSRPLSIGHADAARVWTRNQRVGLAHP